MGQKTISVGQLRQNPTEMIRDVRAGESYVLTDRAVPVADIVPHAPPRWARAEEVAELLRGLGADPVWAAELDELRATVTMRDPWVDR